MANRASPRSAAACRTAHPALDLRLQLVVWAAHPDWWLRVTSRPARKSSATPVSCSSPSCLDRRSPVSPARPVARCRRHRRPYLRLVRGGRHRDVLRRPAGRRAGPGSGGASGFTSSTSTPRSGAARTCAQLADVVGVSTCRPSCPAASATTSRSRAPGHRLRRVNIGPRRWRTPTGVPRRSPSTVTGSRSGSTCAARRCRRAAGPRTAASCSTCWPGSTAKGARAMS